MGNNSEIDHVISSGFHYHYLSLFTSTLQDEKYTNLRRNTIIKTHLEIWVNSFH